VEKYKQYGNRVSTSHMQEEKNTQVARLSEEKKKREDSREQRHGSVAIAG
jgi:hypothetical protein